MATASGQMVYARSGLPAATARLFWIWIPMIATH